MASVGPTFCGTYDTHQSPMGPSHRTWATSKGLPDHLAQSSPLYPCSQQSQVPRACGAPTGDSVQPLFSPGRQREPVAAGALRRPARPPAASQLLFTQTLLRGHLLHPGQGSHGLWVSVVRALPEREPAEEGAWNSVVEGEQQSAWQGREARTRWGLGSGRSAGGSGLRWDGGRWSAQP